MLRQVLHGSRALFRAGRYFTCRSVGRPYQGLAEVARKSEILCEGGSVDAIVPFFWESHLKRICGSRTGSREEVIKNDLRRKTFEFRPVVAYWLRNAALVDGSIFCGRHRRQLKSGNGMDLPNWRLSSPVGACASGALVSTCAGSTWWGHWLADELPLHLAAERLSQPVAFARAEHRDEAAYLRLTGAQSPARFGTATFEELIVVDEFAQNPDKTRRYRLIRESLQQGPSGHDRIHLTRGNWGTKRVLRDEDDLSARLARYGFARIDVSTVTLEQLLQACRGASMVVSVEGSHLIHMLYLMKAGGALVMLNPPHRVLTTVADIGVFCGLSSGIFICEPVGDLKEEFRANPDEVIRFIENVGDYASKRVDKVVAFTDRVIGMRKGAIV